MKMKCWAAYGSAIRRSVSLRILFGKPAMIVVAVVFATRDGWDRVSQSVGVEVIRWLLSSLEDYRKAAPLKRAVVVFPELGWRGTESLGNTIDRARARAVEVYFQREGQAAKKN